MPRGVDIFDENLIQGRVDSDALTYIQKVERADGAALEPGVKRAINRFVINCKAFGLWDKISLIAILAGARSLTGALTTLKGPVSVITNANFTLSDYSRKNGFTGDGTAKTLTLTGYSASYEALNDYHIAVNLPGLDATNASPVWGFGGTVNDTASTHNSTVRSRNTTNITVATWTTGFAILSRDNSSNFNWRNNSTTTNYTSTSVGANTDNFRLFRSTSTYSTVTMNYFSGGKSIAALPLYNDLVSTLLIDIGLAIN